MKRLIVFITYLVSCKLTLGLAILPKKQVDSVSFLLKFTPTSFFKLKPVVQFGNEFRYKNYGLSTEYGLQKGAKLFPGNTYRKEHYFTFQSEIRKYYPKKRKYLAIEYYYSEYYNDFKNYNYYTDHGAGYYLATNLEYLSIAEKYSGLNIKSGIIRKFEILEFDFYFGLGLKQTKKNILFSSVPYEDTNQHWVGILKPYTGYKEGNKIRPNITLGLKLAIPIFSLKLKNKSI